MRADWGTLVSGTGSALHATPGATPRVALPASGPVGLLVHDIAWTDDRAHVRLADRLTQIFRPSNSPTNPPWNAMASGETVAYE